MIISERSSPCRLRAGALPSLFSLSSLYPGRVSLTLALGQRNAPARTTASRAGFSICIMIVHQNGGHLGRGNGGKRSRRGGGDAKATTPTCVSISLNSFNNINNGKMSSSSPQPQPSQDSRRPLNVASAIFCGFGHRDLVDVGDLVLRQTFTMQAVATITTAIAILQAVRGGPEGQSYFTTWRFILVVLFGGVFTVIGTLIWRDIALKFGGACRCCCGGGGGGGGGAGAKTATSNNHEPQRPRPGPETRVVCGLLSLEAASWCASVIWVTRALFCESRGWTRRHSRRNRAGAGSTNSQTRNDAQPSKTQPQPNNLIFQTSLLPSSTPSSCERPTTRQRSSRPRSSTTRWGSSSAASLLRSPFTCARSASS